MSPILDDVVPRTDLLVVDGLPTLVMDFVEGEPLSALVAASAAELDWRGNIDIAISLADAIATLHQIGVLHGDLEPSNIIVTPDRRIVLIDLESATPLEARERFPGTAHRPSLPRSPEHLSSDLHLTAASDLFSLGLILQPLLTGRDPTSGLDADALTEALRAGSLRPTGADTGHLPPEIAAILDQLLAADPAKRYEHADVLVRDLQRCAESWRGRTRRGGATAGNHAAVRALDDKLVGRHEELADLAAALDAAGREGGEAVVVSGVSGVGKSALIHAFGAQVSRGNGVFAYGRFQQGTGTPYSALGDALGNLVRTMMTAAPGEYLGWRQELDHKLASIAASLTSLVPDLAAMLGDLPAVPDLDAADARNRLHRAVTRLVTVTASFRPVVLAIDDLQWADQDSLLLLAEILTTASRNVLVLGAHRAGEFDPGVLERSAGHLRTLSLGDLSRQDLRALLAHVAGEGAELEDVVSEIYWRTGGNPLHVQQLLTQAQRKGVIRHDPRAGRPRWDRGALRSLDITGSVAALLESAIEQLQPIEADVLSAAACLGGEFDLSDVAASADQNAEVVADAIWSALELHLLEAFDARGRRMEQVIDPGAKYRFRHDRVLETARDRLSADAQRRVHLRVGRQFLESHGDSRIFDAARHLDLGKDLVNDHAERMRFAGVELRAAQMARLQASFPLALDCYEAGLALIGTGPTAAQPELRRELHLGAAEAAYLVSKFDLMRKRLEDAEKVLTEPQDRARLAYLRLKAYMAEHRLQEAVEVGLSALRELNEPLLANPRKRHGAMALLRTKRRMRRVSNADLLQLPICQDPTVVEIQRILDQLRNISYIVRPGLFPLVVGKELELTLDHGLGPNSSVSVASYGVLLVAIGDYAGSQRFGEAALQLADLDHCRDARPQTQFLYLNFIRLWRHPISEGLSQLQEAFREALDRGDPEYAGFLAAVLISQSFWVGRPLAEIDALAQSMIPPIRSQHVPSSLCQSTQQFFLNLMGRSEDPFLLAGESGYDERIMLPVAERENDLVSLSVAAITKFALHFWCGDYQGGLPLAQSTEKYLVGLVGTSNVQIFHLSNALSRMHVAPRDRSTARAVRKALKLHKKWAAMAPSNYAAPHELLIGAWAHVRGKTAKAERHLDRAIALADQHHNPLMGALALEEMADLLAKSGRESLSQLMLRTAHRKWLGTGMTVRSERLERMHRWLRSRDLVDAASGTVDPLAFGQLTHAVSAASTLNDLVDVVLATVADTTDASRVLLLMDDGERLAPQAVWRGGTTVIVDGDGDVEHAASIVERAASSGRSVVVNDVGRGEGLAEASLERRTVKAALAVPVRLRSRTIGVVYAEHETRADAFDAAHEEAIVALCAQVAAPLRNIELESQLQEAEEHQRSLVDVQSRFIPSKLLHILDIDDIRRVRRGHRIECEMTVLISDIRGYTTLVEGMTLAEAGDLALDFLRAMEVPIITSNGLLQDLRGDEVLAIFDTGPDDAVRAGLAMQRSLREQNRVRMARGGQELRAGIGINVGPVGLGLVGGVNRMALTVIGDAVNLASRIESANKRYGSSLLIGEQTYRQLTDPEQFHLRRMERVMVVNRRQPLTLYEVYDEDPEPLRAAKRAAQPHFDQAFALFDEGEIDRAAAVFELCREVLPDDHVAELHLAHCAAILRGEMVPGQDVELTHK